MNRAAMKNKARRSLDHQGAWIYQNPEQQAFVIRCTLEGVDFVGIDTFIERLEREGAPAGRELRERRNSAFSAWTAKNKDALRRHLEWLILRRDAILREEALLPLAVKGENKRKSEAKGGITSGRTKKVKAEEWQRQIKTLVLRHLRAGKTNENIGILLAKNAGVGSDRVSRYAAALRKTLKK